MRRIALAGLMVAGALSLAACEKTKEQFDLSKKAPDEFAVTKRAPLEMPPDYSLRPPRPGAPRPQEQATDDQAKAALMGEDAARSAPIEGLTEGETLLLQKTGGMKTDPKIRAIVDKETAALGEEDMPGIDQIKKMVGKDVEPPAKVVDPKAEANRLKKNKQEGKPVTEGETPAIEE